MDVNVLLGVVFYTFTGAVLVWGIRVYLRIRAHLRETDEPEERWKGRWK